MQKYDKEELIRELEKVKMEDGGCAVEEMLTREYETALKKAGFNLKSICRIKDGRYKICTPIQVCRKNRVDVLKAAYEHYYGKGASYTLEEVYSLATTEYRKLVDGGHRTINTFEHYTGAWNRFISTSKLPKMSLTEITRGDLKGFYAEITAPDEDGNRITRSTLRNVITTINLCYDYAMDKNLIESNIASDVKTDKLICGRTKVHDAYSPDEVEKIREALGEIDSVYARIILFDLCMVARIGELEALKWEDVDFEERTVEIKAQIVRDRENGKIIFKYVEYTKPGRHSDVDMGRRTLSLNSKALEILKEQKAKNPDSKHIFESKAGTPLITNRIAEHFRKYCTRAGIRYLPPHSIRSTNITKLFDLNVPPTKIQAAAGHSDLRTTNRYCRANRCPEIEDSVMENL